LPCGLEVASSKKPHFLYSPTTTIIIIIIIIIITAGSREVPGRKGL
jgi:hypothetical protein